jgi:hypothetical protein
MSTRVDVPGRIGVFSGCRELRAPLTEEADMAATATRGAGYSDVLMPVTPGIPCTLEVITLDDRQVIRVKQDGYGIGYFGTPQDAAEHGVDLTTAILRS